MLLQLRVSEDLRKFVELKFSENVSKPVKGIKQVTLVAQWLGLDSGTVWLSD